VASPADAYYQSSHWKVLRAACVQRDGGRCTVPGCNRQGVVADHIVARKPLPYITEHDRIENLRLLCRSHDAQCKEQRRGAAQRKQGGVFRVRGCDTSGWPLDPTRR
jgi:5-methylcytosine-specific restriction endonuclease McrA